MRKVNKGNLKHGKLFHKVSVKLSSDELALRFIADQQKKIDEYERVIDDILLSLLHHKNVSLKHSDNEKVEKIHIALGDYKKALLKSDLGKEFLEKHLIDIFPNKEKS